MKFIYPALLFILLPRLSLAQKNWVDGTIVTSSGESLTGEVDYKNWKNNPRKIKFREKNFITVTNYSAAQLKSVFVAGEKYVSAVVRIDKRSDDINKLSDEREIQTKTDTVFLMALVEGSKSLYYFYDGLSHFFSRIQRLYNTARVHTISPQRRHHQ